MATAPKLRSIEENSLAGNAKLAENVLPTYREVMVHYHYIRQLQMTTDPNFLRKIPGFGDLKGLVTADVYKLGRKQACQRYNLRSIHTKLEQTVEKFSQARKGAKKLNHCSINENWFDRLYDISKCRHAISSLFKVYKGKLLCKCDLKYRIPATEAK